MNRLNPMKIVLVGDGMVGKSAICKSFANKCVHNKSYQTTITETHEISVIVDRRAHPIVLYDTAGLEEFEHCRSRDYIDADCFLCCYAIDNPTSFDNVETKWVHELRKYSPTVPIIILGTKKDIRRPSNTFISEEGGRALQNRVKAQGFIECSSTSLSSLEAVFILSVSIVNDLKLKEQNNCKRFSCDIL